jgi:hypothetical protein
MLESRAERSHAKRSAARLRHGASSRCPVFGGCREHEIKSPERFQPSKEMTMARTTKTEPLDHDILSIEERLDRVAAVLVAMETIAVAGDMFPGRGTVCTTLGIMAAEEMAKARAALGTEVLNRDC